MQRVDAEFEVIERDAGFIARQNPRRPGRLVLACLFFGCTTSGPSALSGSGGSSPGSAGSAANSATAGQPSSAGGSGGAAGASSAQGGVGGTSGTSFIAGASGAAGQGGGLMGGASGFGGSKNGARFPFPQNQRMSRCTYATNADPADAERAYSAWKSELLTASGAGGHLRVRRPNSPGGELNSTVSEGIAYGMLLAVAIDDQPVFDALWKYTQLWLNQNGLMHWYINAAGTHPLAMGGATDSDQDIAYALVLASRQWGGSGSLGRPYLELAKTQIDRVWQFEVDHERGDLLLPGDSWGSNIVFNPSYFAPYQYRVFGMVSGNVAGWNRVIDTGYSILEKSLNLASKNLTNGLVPAWCDENGVPKEPFPGGPTNYQYDSARTPFRIGLDFCYSAEPRAKAYLAQVSGFFADLGAGKIVDGYELDGTPHPDPASPLGGPQSAVFVGCAAVGAMHDLRFQGLIDAAYASVATGQLLTRSRYYNLSWTALTLLMLTGNLIEYSE